MVYVFTMLFDENCSCIKLYDVGTYIKYFDVILIQLKTNKTTNYVYALVFKLLFLMVWFLFVIYLLAVHFNN